MSVQSERKTILAKAVTYLMSNALSIFNIMERRWRFLIVYLIVWSATEPGFVNCHIPGPCPPPGLPQQQGQVIVRTACWTLRDGRAGDTPGTGSHVQTSTTGLVAALSLS